MAAVRPRYEWAARTIPWIVAGAFVLLALRLADYVNRYTVNIIFWDQWDLLSDIAAVWLV